MGPFVKRNLIDYNHLKFDFIKNKVTQSAINLIYLLHTQDDVFSLQTR